LFGFGAFAGGILPANMVRIFSQTDCSWIGSFCGPDAGFSDGKMFSSNLDKSGYN
jgi:hypothetical protein